MPESRGRVVYGGSSASMKELRMRADPGHQVCDSVLYFPSFLSPPVTNLKFTHVGYV